MTFVGEPGAVLDGEGIVVYAFDGVATSAGGVDNVTIRGLVIRNYDTPLQMGAIRAGDHGEASASGWVIEECDIHDNAGGGIRTGHRMVIRNNRIHRNGQIGIVGKGDGMVVVGNEIAYNNTRRIDPGWEAGGTKFVRTRDLVVRGNYVHDNRGPGLWMDGSNVNSLVEDNRVIDNSSAAGVFVEISYGAVIRNNYLEGNGQPGSWLYGSEILVSASSDVEVYGNTVVARYDGITAVMQNRGSGSLGRHEVRNLYVHDNVVTMQNGLTGLGQDIGDDAYFTRKNNRFERNTYNLGSNTHHFTWMNEKLTKPEWHAYGHDNEDDSGAP